MISFSSSILQTLAIFIYFSILSVVSVLSYTKQRSDADFILGRRSMSFWLTALAAHASDMSSWLFTGYPALIYATGFGGAWTGIGLIVFMYLNWRLIAPKVRIATEKVGALTFSTFFEKQLKDNTGLIRVFTALMLFIFYTIYISSAFTVIGYLLNTLFGINFIWGVLAAACIVTPYVFIGGYLTLAWIDLVQGCFLLIVLLVVPLYILPSLGGFAAIKEALVHRHLAFSLFKDFSPKTLFEIFFLMCGWGLGYFGQPHILTKFMGIKEVNEMGKSRRLGMSWMCLSLGAATFVGLVGIVFFQTTELAVNDEVFIQMVKASFSPFFVGLFLCAIFAATINAISSMILVLTSSLTEDLYKKLLRPHASPQELLAISRISVITVAAVAVAIALMKFSSIYTLVFYAWSGLGASFGPLLIGCLYFPKMTKKAAWAAILTGGLSSALWPLIGTHLPISIPSLPPAFILSFVSVWIFSRKERALHKNS